MRWLLVQCAWGAVRRRKDPTQPWTQMCVKRVGRGTSKGRAIVAVANHLTRVADAVLRDHVRTRSGGHRSCGSRNGQLPRRRRARASREGRASETGTYRAWSRAAGRSGGHLVDWPSRRRTDLMSFDEVEGTKGCMAAPALTRGEHVSVRSSSPTGAQLLPGELRLQDRKSTRLNSSHLGISYAVFCLKKKKHHQHADVSEGHRRLQGEARCVPSADEQRGPRPAAWTRRGDAKILRRASRSRYEAPVSR